MKLTLIKIREEVSKTKTFIFKADQQFVWKAGQFIQIKLEIPDSDQRKNERFFTIASAPFEKNIYITTKFTEDSGSTFKQVFQTLKVEDVVEGSGPTGDFTLEEPSGSYTLIAGGIGITPFRSILLQLNHDQKPINATLLYANSDQNIVYKNEFEMLQQNNPDFKIKYIFSPQRIDSKMISAEDNYLKRTYFISGPTPMVQSMIEILKSLGVTSSQIKTDYFPGYTWN